MATTIARLSAVVTTDTSQFQQGFDRAGFVVQRFQSRAEGSNNSLGQLAKELAHTQHGAEKASGSFLKMAAFGLGGGPIALAALAATLGVKWVEAADKADESRRRIIEDINQIRAAAEAGPAELPRALTQESAMEELRRETRANIEEAKQFWGINSGPESKSAIERLEELKKKTVAWAAEQKKLRDDEAKASAERAREFDRLRSSADSIARSLRTPVEIWRDTINEIARLNNLGLLSFENYRRGIAKANDELNNANKSASQLRTAGGGGAVPAVDRFSTAAFSAIQAAVREITKQEEIQKAQLEVGKAQKKELEAINQQLDNRPIVTIKTARLN